MARKVLVNLIDDLTGKEADETVEFGLDGVGYEIDLSKSNAEKLRKQLATFVAGARRTTPVRRSRTKSNGPSLSAQVRAWATENGHEVPARGRIPQSVMSAYQEVHGGR